VRWESGKPGAKWHSKEHTSAKAFKLSYLLRMSLYGCAKNMTAREGQTGNSLRILSLFVSFAPTWRHPCNTTLIDMACAEPTALTEAAGREVPPVSLQELAPGWAYFRAKPA
jgi:hypothetical protein